MRSSLWDPRTERERIWIDSINDRLLPLHLLLSEYRVWVRETLKLCPITFDIVSSHKFDAIFFLNTLEESEFEWSAWQRVEERKSSCRWNHSIFFGVKNCIYSVTATFLLFCISFYFSSSSVSVSKWWSSSSIYTSFLPFTTTRFWLAEGRRSKEESFSCRLNTWIFMYSTHLFKYRKWREWMK